MIAQPYSIAELRNIKLRTEHTIDARFAATLESLLISTADLNRRLAAVETSPSLVEEQGINPVRENTL